MEWHDRNAINIFKSVFVGRDIIPMKLDVITRNGGGIHCSTWHLPGRLGDNGMEN